MRAPVVPSTCGSKPALNSKGLRHTHGGGKGMQGLLQASPEFKGIKTRHLHGVPPAHAGSKPALNSKGLRRILPMLFKPYGRSKPALNSKGLRHATIISSSRWRLQASPEFKGIKTMRVTSVSPQPVGSKPALNSKGLRRDDSLDVILRCALQASPEFKGIKTVSFGAPGCICGLQASPEFKGIKTQYRWRERHA